MTRHVTAPELDGILSGLTPEELEQLRARIPAGYADQVEAARAEAVQAMEYAENDRVGWVPPTEIDEWIRLGALDTLILWVDGRARTCMHSPDYRRPQPVFSCAWRPGLVVCMGCLHLLNVAGEADKTCDRCGHICEGVDADDGIYTGTVWLGALGFQFGTCAGCRLEDCAA